MRVIYLTILLSAFCTWNSAKLSSGQGIRQQISLNGTWQFQKVVDLQDPAPVGGIWSPMDVPGTEVGYDYERMWVKREFSIPADFRGKRIKIQFDGVKYNSRVVVNGRTVGGCFNGYDPFEVDITDVAKIGGTNTLAVGCHDWTGVFSSDSDRVDFSRKPAWQRPRRFVEDQVIAPIGGHYDQYGIWGDVRLVAVPAVYLSDLFIKPSVRKQELEVEYSITNESDQPATGRLSTAVEADGIDCLVFEPVSFQVPAGQTINKTVRRRWPEARHWSHEDPHLYQLRSQLSTGDQLESQFGFREFWVEGHRYVLNGKKVNLLATSWWPPREPIEREEIEKQFRAIKAAGINCFRTHTQTWRRVYYEVADELGLLMIAEGAMWHDPYCTAYHDPTFWDNYEAMIKAMIDREKNRASVIMWSMENESFSGKEKTELALKYLPRAGRRAKQWDPTRPIYFESDGDPGGVADAIGLHYVHEYPEYNCWPNEAYWLDEPFQARSWFVTDDIPVKWDKQKPLYLGEFLWAPSGTPAPHTIFFGDDAYRDFDRYRLMAKAEVWKMQILAFRHQEAGGISPWTVGDDDLSESNPLYRAHQYAYQPLAAYCLDYDRRFFSEELVSRQVTVFNDRLSRSELELESTLVSNGQTVEQQKRVLTLDAGERQPIELQLKMPQVDHRIEIVWKIRLSQNGKAVFSDNHAYAVFPKSKLPPISNIIGLFEPDRQRVAAILQASQIRFQPVEDLAEIGDDIDILIIAPEALNSQPTSGSFVVGKTDPRRGALNRFMDRGGRVLALRQSAYPSGLFDSNLTIQKSTMTFPLRPSHDALSGVQAEDLKFWRGDHLVATNELSRPASGPAVSLVVSGSKPGLANTALLERPSGRGTALHCQLLLIEKFETEPMARLIFGNLLQYLDRWESGPRQTLLIGGDQEYREKLASDLRVRFQEFDSSTFQDDLESASLVICRGGNGLSSDHIDDLRRYVAAGGNLIVHRPDEETFRRLAPGFDLNVEMQSLESAVAKTDNEHALTEAITREDLYWTRKVPGVSWTLQPLAQNAIDGVFGVRFERTGLQRSEIERWDKKGNSVKNTTSGVLFASNGTASQAIDVEEDCLLGIGVLAKGTACEGEFPIVQFSVDGNIVGAAQIQDTQDREYGVVANVKKGRHKITVAFVNDASDDSRGEDRNLEVDCVFVGAIAESDRNLTYLTVPGALAVAKFGKGQVVFDRIRWDTEFQNGQKAARHACSLLTALGASFSTASALTIETEEMTPNEGIPYFNVQGGITYMGSNGYLQTELEVAQAGTYRMELLASGESSEGIFPLVEIHVGDRKIADVQLTTGVWKRYPVTIQLEEGKHDFRLNFVNDHWASTGDRNLELDHVRIYRAQ